MTRPYSDSQLDAEAQRRSDTPVTELIRKYGAVPCPSCKLPMLPEHPHNHHTDPQPGYDPMPNKPDTRERLVALIYCELVAEADDRLHTWAVPSEAEPIWQEQRYKRDDPHEWATDIGPGYLKVTDAGELGAPSFSPSFHRRIGGYHYDEELEAMVEGRKPTPWTRNLEGIRRWCSGKHRTWYEHQGRPLCWTLIQLHMFGGYSVGKAAEQAGISLEKAEALLFGYPREDGKHQDGAFDKWWTWAGNDVNGTTAHRVRPKAA